LFDDTFFGSKNASIFLNSNFSERKVNVNGTWASQKSNFFNIFQKHRKKPQKKYEKTGNIYAKQRFDKIQFF
jgi:hypothetical protein